MNVTNLAHHVLLLHDALAAAESKPVGPAQVAYDKARAELEAWVRSATAELGEKCATCPALQDPLKVKPDGGCRLAVQLCIAALQLADAKAAASVVARAMYGVVRAAESDGAAPALLAKYITGGEWH